MTILPDEELSPSLFKDNNKENNERRPPIEKEENDAIHRMTEFERSMSDLNPGDYITITRTEPQEFAGALERVEIDPEKPIDLEYIKSKWGGTAFRIRVYGPGQKGPKGGFDIPMRSFPPRAEYKLLRSKYDEDRLNQVPAQNPLELIEGMFGLMQKIMPAQTQPAPMGGFDVVELLKLVSKNISPPRSDPMSEMTKTIGMIKELQSLSGLGSHGGDEDDLFGKIATIAEKFFTASANQPQAPGIAPPAQRRLPLPEPHQPSEPDLMGVLKTLGQLEPSQIAQLVTGYIGQLPDKQREDITGAVIRGLGMEFGSENEESVDSKIPDIEMGDEFIDNR